MATVRLSGIRVIVFDLDDTLYPERSFAFSGFDAVAEWMQRRMTCPFDPAARMRELFDTPHRARVFDQLLAEMGYPDPAALVPEMIDCYRNHPPAIRLFEDAERALRRWAGPFHLGLISDGPLAMQQGKVEALGLSPLVNSIILTDRWGRAYWKPHPRSYEVIEVLSGWRGATCVYVADNVAKDFQAPRRLGWRTIRVRRPGGIYAGQMPAAGQEPELEAGSLDDVDITS